MARSTRGRVSRSNVRGGAGFLIFLCVAIDAIRGSPSILAACVATLAIQSGVRPSQGKVTELLMRESCPEPRILRMAVAARFRKIERHMIGIRRALKLRGVAGRAVRQDAILPADEGFVTGFTFRGGMSPNKREQILVIANLFLGGEPALLNVALGAVWAKLAQMNVGMAIGAVLPDIGEDRLGMALAAGHFAMPAAEGIPRLIVIEFRKRTKRRPAGGRMTIFTRNLERTVRVWSGILLCRRRRTA